MKRVLGCIRRADERYRMIHPGDKVCVGVSGGKDSLLLLYGLKLYQKFCHTPFELIGVMLDLGISDQDYQPVADFAESIGVPFEILKTDIGDVVFNIRQESHPCALCAKMRRGALHNALREHGITKIALGHHFDDVIETILMSMLYGAQVNTMMPKLHSTNFEGMELIRPLYLVKEADILAWKDYNHLRFLQCACRFTEAAARENEEEKSKRQEMKKLIAGFRKTNPYIETNIFKSVENVNLDACIGYVKHGERHNFLEEY